MSTNFFAALDDSGDEAPANPVAEKKQPSKPKVAEPSRVDQRKRPDQGDRNTKYGRGGRAPARDGKRAYDRRSGTGRGKEIKKGGGGARNWGSDKNEARQAQGHVEEGEGEEEEEPKKPEDEADNSGQEGQEYRKEEQEEVPQQDPEEGKLTYEEFMSVKANPDNEAFAPVKEREVSNEFSGMKVSKVVNDEEFMVMGGGKQKKNKQKNNANKRSITPDFRVASGDDMQRSGRGGRGRGGRDGGRGRGGRGGSGRGGHGGRSGGRGGDGGVNVMDESAFPSLG